MEANYYFFIGTLAEFIKLFPIMLEMDKNNIPYKVISSGQNDLKSSDIYKLFDSDKFFLTINENQSKSSLLNLLFWFFKSFFKGHFVFKEHFKDKDRLNKYLIIHGDTISSLLGGLLGKLHRFKIYHVESGLRSFNFLEPFPEEINRVILSNFVDFHICPDKLSSQNIKNKKGIKLVTKQNTLIDSLRFSLEQKVNSDLTEKLKDKKYAIFVCHRQENVINKKLLQKFVDVVKNQSNKMVCILILHEITKLYLLKFGLYSTIEGIRNVIIVNRLPYFELTYLMQNAEFLVTDGGSNQEEVFYLGLPTLILRNYTERQEGLGHNALLWKKDYSLLDSFLAEYENYRKEPFYLINKDRPAETIVKFMISNEKNFGN